MTPPFWGSCVLGIVNICKVLKNTLASIDNTNEFDQRYISKCISSCYVYLITAFPFMLFAVIHLLGEGIEFFFFEFRFFF